MATVSWRASVLCSREPTYHRFIQAIGLYDYGDDTGCSSTAPTLREAFEEISAWLALPENAEELLFIKMETFVGTDVRF